MLLSKMCRALRSFLVLGLFFRRIDSYGNNRYDLHQSQPDTDIEEPLGQESSFPDFSQISNHPKQHVVQKLESQGYENGLQNPIVDHGQNLEDAFAGQKYEDTFTGQNYDSFISGGQRHETFHGQHHEDFGGQRHEDFGGQRHEDFGGQRHEDPFAADHYESLFPSHDGQILQDPFSGQKTEDISGQNHENPWALSNQDHLLTDFESLHFGRTKQPPSPLSIFSESLADRPPPKETELFPQDQSIIFPEDTSSGSSFRGGCNGRPPVPMNSMMQCSIYEGCKATCQKGYEFPNGDVLMFITCQNGRWKIGLGDDWQVVPACRPVCLPGCQNNGICIGPNQCQCPKNFGGPQCQFEKKPCLNYPPLPANSMRSCTSKTCTVTCAKGFEFPDGSTITNMICKEGQWRLSRTDWVSLPDCRAICDPPCTNGGVCLSLNICQCPQQFTGPQCQYEMSACSGEKLHFNGIHNCAGNGERLVCELSCPPGIESSSPFAEEYTCLYSTGHFSPQPIPSCQYGENVIVVPFNSSSRTYYSASLIEKSSYGKGPSQKSGKQISWDIVSLFEADRLKPAPGSCYVWGGTHVKNFDGGMYSFSSPCSLTLVKDMSDSSFEIAMHNEKCEHYSSCERALTILYQNKEYNLSHKGGVTGLEVDGKATQIPSQLVGLSVEATPLFTVLKLHSLDVTITWNGVNFLSISLNENLWNKTGGLCGNLNKDTEDDFLQKTGDPAPSLESFLDSWTVTDLNSSCAIAANVTNECASISSHYCDTLLKDPYFAPCREVLNVKPFYDACLWDTCTCGVDCSCLSVAAFVHQCQKHLDNPCPKWRTIVNCPFQCPPTKVYSSCGATRQPTCGDYLDETGLNAHECVEGCVCPAGTVLHAGVCVQKELCPCQLRGKSFPTGSTIPKGCNTCSCHAGRWTCTEARCEARCSSIGDPHYVTFDGRRFDFMGQCSYYLVWNENFTIEADNVPCSGAISKAMLLSSGPDVPTCTRAVTVRIGDRVIRLKQTGQVYVNGEEVNAFPHQDQGFAVRSVSSLFLIVALDNGVDVWWDGVTSVYVDAPASLQGQTKGLCGTFNLNQKDDFLTPEGDIEQAAIPFANKWKTEETCREVVDKISEHPCDRDPRKKERALTLCAKLKSSVFKSCHWYVDVDPFYQNCLYDMCSCALDERSCVCPVYTDYASECSREGVPIVWRTEIRECGLHCPGGQTYQACGDTCARSCQDISLFPSCRRRCVEGCNCPEGKTLDNTGVCIPISQCPCLHHGREYLAGAQLVIDNFKGPQFCNCTNAVWECRPATAAESKEHSEIEEIKSKCLAVNHEEFTFCEPPEPITCKNMHNPVQHSAAKCTPGCVCKKGFVWDVLGKRCVLSSECPCHHGGVSYDNGAIIQQDCNTCTCTSGRWHCTDRECPSTCSTWGDSHFKTFDGRIFDFQGSCDFLLSGGALSDLDVFDIKLQVVPCGTLGVSCPKSVTLTVGKNAYSEEIVLTKGRPVPAKNFTRIAIRDAGLFVFVEIFDLGIVLQWDRGTRIYLKLDPKWRSKVKGLCGNMNNDDSDDFNSPSGGVSEVSPVLFADSWRLHMYCPESTSVQDSCLQNLHRKQWALEKCSVLKSALFQPCHSEVDLNAFFERCVQDTCGCDQGGDCECLCTAVAAYAHECSLRGVPIRWRSREMCPMQCDLPGSKYQSCVSPCPVKTCDNLLVHNGLTQFCSQEACVEGCERPVCPEGSVFSNSSMVECVEPSQCKTACLSVNGVTYFEGDLMESDECYSCYCSRHQKVCSGVPCALQTTSTERTIHSNDAGPLCVDGWTSWINTDHPLLQKKRTDYEPLPSLNILMLVGSAARCNTSQMANIRCRDSLDLRNFKETGFDVECSLERGLICDSTTQTCPDFEISVLCQCQGLFTPTTTTQKPTTIVSPCPVGEKWVECAIPCNRTCHYFAHYLIGHNQCNSSDSCLSGCQPESWKPCPEGEWLRDAQTCVSKKDCTCRSDSGDIVKPGSVFHQSNCSKCQCIANQYECDFSSCFAKPSLPASTTASPREDQNIVKVTKPSIRVVENKNITIIFITTPSSVTPPPKCTENRYHSLTKNNLAVKRISSSHLEGADADSSGMEEGSWTAGVENLDQYLEIDLGEVQPVYGVTVGGDRRQSYVTSFRISHSEDGVVFQYLNTPQKIDELFRGPIDSTVPVKIVFGIPFEARFIRFIPFTWVGTISMRVDVLGCGGEYESTTIAYETTSFKPICNDPLGLDQGLIPTSSVSVSSSNPWNGPDMLKMSSESAWKPLSSSHLEFVTIDLREPRNVTGIETKGLPQRNQQELFTPEAWVESYKVFYSPDGEIWNPVMDNLGKQKVFLGNFDGDSGKTNWFDRPIKARFFKIIPVSWRHEIALRLELLGCYESYTTTTSTPPKIFLHAPELCSVCDGLERPDPCPCSGDLWWNGDSCSSRSECPCVLGHMTYGVGNIFINEKCEECTCRINGVQSCVRKICPQCPPSLRSQLTSSCGCICKPCNKGTRLCPTTEVCIPEQAWCDGVDDCPDDEVNCTSPFEEHEKNITCPSPVCPPGYKVVYGANRHEFDVLELGNYKAVKKGTKGGSKGMKRPTPVKMQKQPVVCPPYECVAIPTEKPILCPEPSCPVNYTVVMPEMNSEASFCPRYSCRPPPERAICTLSGRSFTTFDGIEYKYDICDHILVSDIHGRNWKVSVFKTCRTLAPCYIGVRVYHDETTLEFADNSSVRVNGFEYTKDQIDTISSLSSDFNVSRNGEFWIFHSLPYGFTVVMDGRGNIKVQVESPLKGEINGLCGLYNGIEDDDKTRPDGTVSRSTVDFGKSWMTPEGATCDNSVCPIHLQEVALEMCYRVKNEPFDSCSGYVNLDHFIGRCLEKTCVCLQSNRTADECRCNAFLDFVTSCRSINSSLTFPNWRLTHDCVPECPKNMIWHDCYPYNCEPTCSQMACSLLATSCYSGCYCTEGLVRRGDTCIRPSECRDCVCSGLSSSYLGFDRTNFTFTGNCSYVAARDVGPSGVPNFQVIVSNKPCIDGEGTQCPDEMTVFLRGHKIFLKSDETKTVNITVDEKFITPPLSNDWLVIDQIEVGPVNVQLLTHSLTLSFVYPTFEISVPSHIYSNRIEGLCGNCNQNPTDDDSSSQALAEKWLVKSHNHQERCDAPKVECPYTAFESEIDLCRTIENKQIFGKCHPVVDPSPYLSLCLASLCHNGSLCESVGAYAKACRNAGLCIDWRSPRFCPYHCPPGLVYKSCGLGCSRTCETFSELDAKPESCAFQNVEGCSCPEDYIMANGSCFPTSWCDTCDDFGHRSGDIWHPDKCSNCTCVGKTVSCKVEECSSVFTVCPEGYSPLVDTHTTSDCCAKYICVLNPTEPSVTCPETSKPDCGFGQILKIETDFAGCPHFVCRCKDIGECDELPVMDENELPVGMIRIVNSSGCCPRSEIICDIDKCPSKPECEAPYELAIVKTDCCPLYRCEKPEGVCIYKPDHYSKLGSKTAHKPGVWSKKVGSKWNDGPCKSCECVERGADVEAVCIVRECLPIHLHPDYKDFELQALPSEDPCCPKIVRVACKHESQVFNVGEWWIPTLKDHCTKAICIRDKNNVITKEIQTETCNTDCDFGWKYMPKEGQCCGQCVQAGCVFRDELYLPGQLWHGADNCTTFSCETVHRGYLVTSEAEKCPDISGCPVEDQYQDGCCLKCRPPALEQSNCAAVEVKSKETVQIVSEIQTYHGKCVNMEPIPHFTECRGACDSHTVYNKATWNHDSVCECCQGIATKMLRVPLTCDDGYVIEKTVAVPARCKCQSCGG